MSTLFNVVLPVFLIAGVVLLLQPRLRLDGRSLSRLSLMVFVPALTFETLVLSDFTLMQLGQLALGLALVTAALLVLGELLARLLHLDAAMRGAFMLSVIMINAGAYGFPVLTFAFGAAALLPATMMVLLFNAFLLPVASIYLAAIRQAPIGKVFQQILQTPVIYAALLGLLARLTGVTLPSPLLKAVSLLAQAAIPLLLIVLGVQLAELLQQRERPRQLPALAVVLGLRLVLAPLLALLLAGWLGLEGTGRAALVIDSGMSTAILAAALAAEFEADVAFTTLSIFATTLFSLVTVTCWLNFLL